MSLKVQVKAIMDIIEKIIICIIISFSVLSCSESSNSYYASINDAKKDNAIERGILPAALPQSSTNIFEFHHIDIGGVYVKFMFDNKGYTEIESKTKRLGVDGIVPLHSTISGFPEWWPSDLNTTSMKNADENFKFIVFRYDYIVEYANSKKDNKAGYFFLNKGAKQGYYFSE